MIVDFEERLILPPPFTLLVYFVYILKWLGRLLYRAVALVCARNGMCGPGGDLKVGGGVDVVERVNMLGFLYYCVLLSVKKHALL